MTGLGGRCENLVYHMSLPQHCKNLGIVQLEMINILVAIRIFSKIWSKKHVLVKCDNQAVVTVLTSGKTRDAFLAACARNIWLALGQNDTDASYVHVLGKNNQVADLLSRWQNTVNQQLLLGTLVQNPIWLKTDEALLQIDCEI